MCTYPGMPPLSMWLAKVTSFDHTSNCHLINPNTPQCTRPVCIPTRIFTLTAITSRTKLSKGNEQVSVMHDNNCLRVANSNLNTSIDLVDSLSEDIPHLHQAAMVCRAAHCLQFCTELGGWSPLWNRKLRQYYLRNCIDHIEAHFNGTVCMIRSGFR